MHNCAILKFIDITDKYGHLTPIEERIDVPFDIKRIYYISNVQKGVTRGYHAHRRLHQVLICVKGSVKVKVVTPKEEEVFELNDQTEGLYLGPYTWREMFDFTEDAVLLVLASEYHDESDYIRNIDFYMEEAKKRF